MITVKVPATSANLGAGFDCMGLAVGLWNTAAMELSDRIEITSADDTPIPQDEHNLIYGTVDTLFHMADEKLPGLRLVQTNAIPMTRGLGSSSACIAAGLVGGNALLGWRYSTAELVDIAAGIEGHPDNVAPALLGGLTISAIHEGRVVTSRSDLAGDIAFLALVPDTPLETSRARAALPKQIAHSDAVYNLSRAALFAASITSREYRNLRAACSDRLHQPYRIGLIDGGEEAIELMYSIGAYASFISGAGSTLLGIFPSDGVEAARAKALEWLELTGKHEWRALALSGENTGAHLI